MAKQKAASDNGFISANAVNGAPIGTTPDGAAVYTLEQFKEFRDLIGNVISTRREFLNTLLDPRRDVEQSCGYPSIAEPVSPQMYYQLYERDALAARLVEIYPKECWKVEPEIYEDPDPDTETAWEAALADVCKGLAGAGARHYAGDAGNPLWDYCRRLDIAASINQYAIMLLGFNDSIGPNGEMRPLSEPLAGVVEAFSMPAKTGKGKGKDGSTPDNDNPPIPNAPFGVYNLTVNAEQQEGRRLDYIRIYADAAVTISQVETNPTSPQVGQPVMYSVQLGAEWDGYSGAAALAGMATVLVHWTRVIHYVPNALMSEIFSVPIMRAPLNNLLGLHKLYAAAPEMFYKGAFPGIALETHPSLGAKARIDRTQVRDMMQDYENDMQRWLALLGMSAKTLSPNVSDPTPFIKGQLEAVAMFSGVPMRKMLGSERGELSSTQDEGDWNDKVAGRQNNVITPRMLIPLFGRLIDAGALPVPGAGFFVDWPPLDKQSATEQSDFATKIATAGSQYTTSGLDAYMAPLDFWSRVCGFSEPDARAIVEAAENRADENDTGTSPLLSLVGGITGMIELLKIAQAGGLTEEQFKQQVMLFFGVDEIRAEALAADGFAKLEEQRAKDETAAAAEAELAAKVALAPVAASPAQPANTGDK